MKHIFYDSVGHIKPIFGNSHVMLDYNQRINCALCTESSPLFSGVINLRLESDGPQVIMSAAAWPPSGTKQSVICASKASERLYSMAAALCGHVLTCYYVSKV